MFYAICFYLSLLVFIVFVAAAIATAVIKAHSGHSKIPFKPFYLIFIGVFLSAVTLFIPIYWGEFHDNVATLGERITLTLAISIHNTLRLFVLDGDFETITIHTATLSGYLPHGYNVLASILYIVSPFLTFGAVLSFFESLKSKIKLFFAYHKNTYVFSEVNEKSLALAESLREYDKRGMLVFTDVTEKNGETAIERIEKAKELGAVLCKEDITSVNFKWRSKKTKLYFMIIGEDETENINQLVSLASKPRGKIFKKSGMDKCAIPINDGYDYPGGDKRIYLFSREENSEILVNGIQTDYIRVRRVDDISAMILQLFYQHGDTVFETAIDSGNQVLNQATGEMVDEKLISALIVGGGYSGTAMLKTMTWFGQMFPYRLQMYVVDKESNVRDRLAAQFPEIMNEPHNGDFETDGESHYSVDVIENVDVDTVDLENAIKKIGKVTYAFVALGDDERTINKAIELRIIFRRLGMKNTPAIHAVVRNSFKNRVLNDPKNTALKAYEILTVGDIESNYSVETVIRSDLEAQALNRHMAWANKLKAEREAKYVEIEKEAAALAKTDATKAKEKLKELEKMKEEDAKWYEDQKESFWKVGYNYRSNLASVIHSEYKRRCKVPGAGKKPRERTKEENDFYKKLEHARWNAYVRSEGYVFTAKRDRLAKTHNLLVPFDDLSEEEKAKDED